MQNVWMIEQKEEVNGRYGKTSKWTTKVHAGVFTWEAEAVKQMHEMIASEQAYAIRQIPEMRSTKRGEGKHKFNEKVREITQIPSKFRIIKIRTS
mgnify:FL=1|tara:strand:- start:3066 stop:3350 length:285 start_codon:yes stop_codon:yes gene_type:complete